MASLVVSEELSIDAPNKFYDRIAAAAVRLQRINLTQLNRNFVTDQSQPINSFHFFALNKYAEYALRDFFVFNVHEIELFNIDYWWMTFLIGTYTSYTVCRSCFGFRMTKEDIFDRLNGTKRNHRNRMIPCNEMLNTSTVHIWKFHSIAESVNSKRE